MSATNFWSSLPRPILALAPMEGVTDVSYRQLCKEQGADVVYTEFISSDAIAHNARTALEKMKRNDAERPVICQIFGRDPHAFAVAAKKVEELGFDGVDINFGCPARKVVGHGSGVALLREPAFARTLIEAALSTVTIPVSIKVRTSIRKERQEILPGAERSTVLDLLEAVDDLPIAAIMVHGRSFEAGHSGSVDMDMIRQVKERFSGVVLANGGITSPEEAITMLQHTSADGIGIARGSWGQPWIFSQVRDLITTGQFTSVTKSTILSTLLRHAELSFAAKGSRGLLEFRKHAAHYLRGQPGAADFRRQAVTVSTLDDVKRLIERIG